MIDMLGYFPVRRFLLSFVKASGGSVELSGTIVYTAYYSCRYLSYHIIYIIIYHTT